MKKPLNLFLSLFLFFSISLVSNAQNDTTNDSWRTEGNTTLTDSTTIITNRLGIGSANMSVEDGLHLQDKSFYLQGGNTQWRIYSSSGNFWIRNESGNLNSFRMTSTGRLGLGTGGSITPSAQLHVKSYDHRALLVEGGLNQGTVPIFQVRTHQAESLFSVLANRKMGIGTTDPTASLEISTSDSPDFQDYSGLKIKGDYNYSAAQIINMYEGNAAGGLLIETTDQTGTADALRVVTARSNNQKRMLRIPNYSAQNNAILLAEDGGNVGIGTSTPTNKLDVCGNIRAKEVVIESGWCDYVFHANYSLPSLKEQKDFIEEHGHLKNFDAASKMDGQIEVADVTTKQQQTLEEMMLYLIQLEEKMTGFQEENQRLQTRIAALEKQLDNQEK